MRRKGKKRTNEESPAGSDDADGSPARKKPSREPNDDSFLVCDISKNRKVSVRSWRGKVAVDIREFYMKDGKQFPGKKGISLTMDQWYLLKEHMDEIDKAVEENA